MYDKMSREDRISANHSSSEDSSMNDLPKRDTLNNGDLKSESNFKGKDRSVIVLVARKQRIIFLLSYLINLLGLTGLSYQYVTATFYFDPEKKEDNVTLSDI